MDADKLLDEITGRVREALDRAEARAREIVADAEAEAQRIRERAESEADERLAKVREALAGLEGALGTSSGPSSEVEPGPVEVPEPSPPPIPEPQPPPVPEPQPPAEPEPQPPEPEIEPPAPAQPDRSPPAAINGGSAKGDEIGARIVATKMARDGATREEIAAHLAERYEVADPDALLDFVMERAARK